MAGGRTCPESFIGSSAQTVAAMQAAKIKDAIQQSGKRFDMFLFLSREIHSFPCPAWERVKRRPQEESIPYFGECKEVAIKNNPAFPS
jgi:hypothetical protein